MNVLIIGNNPKHAKVFSIFSENVYLLIQKNEYRVSNEVNEYNLIYSDLIQGSVLYSGRRIKEIQNIVKSNNIDIIFSNRKDDMILSKRATKKMNNAPLLLVTFHNSLAWMSSIKVALLSYLIEKNCDGCVCLSSFMYQKLISNGINEDKLLFLPNTIDYKQFKKKDNYSIQHGKVKICYTAVIRPLKNQEFIIDVIYALHKRYQFEVHFYGDILDEQYYKKLINKIRELQIEELIYFDGRVDHESLKKILPHNDIYFSSTTIEMSPYNILEAQACALPILASNVYGQQDLIEDNMDGILYEESNIIDATEKIVKMIEDDKLRFELGLKAFESVSNLKSPKVAAIKMEQFVEQLRK